MVEVLARVGVVAAEVLAVAGGRGGGGSAGRPHLTWADGLREDAATAQGQRCWNCKEREAKSDNSDPKFGHGVPLRVAVTSSA
jgi:hypothetical protein